MLKKNILSFVAWLVFCLSILPFIGAVSYGLINFDDYQYTIDKPQLTGEFVPSTVAWLLGSVDDAIWMPVTRISFLLDFKLLGGSPHPMHAVNAVVHGLNGVLLFFLLLHLFRPSEALAKRSGPGGRGLPGQGLQAVMACGLGALLWSVHPLRVESVVWVASRKDVLFLFFELAAFLFWVRRLEYEEGSARSDVFWWAAVVCFALAGMSKPAAMTFPALAGLLELVKGRGVMRWRDYTVPVVMACSIGAVGLYAQRMGGATEALADVPIYGRLLNAAAAFGFYCWKTVYPVGLALQCENRWPGLPRFWLQGLLICAAYGSLFAILCVRLYGAGLKAALDTVKAKGRVDFGTLLQAPGAGPHGKALVFASLAFFLAAVAPTLGLSNFGAHAFADRFTYLPAVGFSVLLAGFLVRGGPWKGIRTALGSAGLVALLFAYLAGSQTRFWRDEKTLFTHTLEVDGETNICANGIVGIYCYEVEHDFTRALFYLDRAFRDRRRGSLGSLQPVYVKILAESGDTARARDETRRFLAQTDRALNGDLSGVNFGGALQTDAASYLLYAIIAFEEGETALAKEHILKFDQSLPDTTWAAYLLGRIALKEGDKEGAIRFWKKSISKTNSYVRHRFIEKELHRLELEVASSGRPSSEPKPTSKPEDPDAKRIKAFYQQPFSKSVHKEKPPE